MPDPEAGVLRVPQVVFFYPLKLHACGPSTSHWEGLRSVVGWVPVFLLLCGGLFASVYSGGHYLVLR